MQKINKDEKCPVCNRYLNRATVVDAIILNDKDEIVLIKRKNHPYKNFYAIPGGFIDWDETAKEAVIREAKEETNLDVEIISFLNFFDSIKRDERRRTISLCFVCKIKKNSNCLQANDDASKAAFFSLEKLPKNLAFDHNKIIYDFLKTRKRPLNNVVFG